MRNEDWPAFNRAFDSLAELYANYTPSEHSKAAYWRYLKKWDLEVVRLACERAPERLSSKSFFPCAPELGELCVAVQREKEPAFGMQPSAPQLPSGEVLAEEQRATLYDEYARRWPWMADFAGKCKRNEIPCNGAISELAQHLAGEKTQPYGQI